MEETNSIKSAADSFDFGDEIMGWRVPEHEKYERTKRWYITASIISLLLLIFSFLTHNFLFAVIIIVSALIIILREGQEPILVKFAITDEGIVVGRKFYDYDEIKDFSIVYKPKAGVKNIYFEFKNPIKHRLSIPFYDANPLSARENLLKYLTENLDRTDQSLSEALGKLFRI